MYRISIKWMTDETSKMLGIVQVHEMNDYLGEWLVEVDEYTTHHKPLNNSHKHLPPICQNRKLMRQVEEVVHIYMDGFRRSENTGKWLDKKPTIPEGE